MKASWLLVLAPLLLAARPGTEFNLVTQLNGQPTRWTLPDGGRSGVFSATTSGCMTLSTPTTIINGTSTRAFVPNVLLIVPGTPGGLCIRPSTQSTYWDGGCTSYSPTDENFGVPMAVGVPQYIVPTTGATAICFHGDAGTVSVPIWGVE